MDKQVEPPTENSLVISSNACLWFIKMQQRYDNLNGPKSIVILASEFSHCGTNGGRDKIFCAV